MNEQQIRQLIRSEIQANSSASRFALNTTQRHIHNGVDSPFAFQPTAVYVGSISSQGIGTILPGGWSVVRNSTGSYTITHGLGTTIYIVTGNANSTKNVLIVTDISPNTFTVNLFETVTLSLQNAAFYFTLVVPNNKSKLPPSY